MKIVQTYIKELLADRPLFLLCLIIIAVALGMMIYFGLHIAPRELQIATHFSSFGETGLYRNKWYYMLTFIVLIVVIGVGHIALIAKLLQREMRSFAIGFGWLTILLLLVVALTVASIFRIAYPGV